MCWKPDIMCDTTMTSVNPETSDLRSRDSRETQHHDVIEFTSHIEDDVIKRIPVLGPTRKQTELFFLGKQDKPCTADPIKRHNRDNLRDPNSHDVTSGNRPSSSYNAFNPQQTNNALWLKQLSRPPKHSPALTRPTVHAASKSISLVTTNSTTRPNFQSYDVQSKHGNSLLTHWPNSGYDTPPRYCVINSIGNNIQTNAPSRESSSTTLRKSGSPVKDLINPKSTHSFVITADTSSLLVQSKSPFKPTPGSSAVGSRIRAKSAIQKVSEANYKSIVKSRSAQSRLLRYRTKQNSSDKSNVSNSNTSHSASYTTKAYKHQNNTSNTLSLPTDASNSHTNNNDNKTSHVEDRSFSPESPNNYLKRYYSDASLHPTNRRKLRSGAKQGSLSPRVVPVENCDQSFLVVQRASTQLSFSKPHTPTRELSSSPMADRRRGDFSSCNDISLPGNKQTSSMIKKGKSKTLTPSKHGYHPRSNSPTFKRLVAAVERLNQTTTGKAPSCPTFRSTDDGSGDSVSTDSHSGYRNFKDCYALNDVTDSDYTESDGNSRTSDLRLASKASRVSRKENSRASKNSKISARANRYPSETRQSRDVKPSKPPRDQRAIRNSSITRESDFPPEEIVLPPTAGLITSEDIDDEIGAFESSRTKEPETRVQEGQPTQLHFFLPQLADSVSEVSGATGTARSHYQERRLELMSRNDESHSHSHNATDYDHNGSTNRSRAQNGGGGNGADGFNNSKYSRSTSNPPCDKSSSVGVKCLPKQKHYPGQQNGHSDKQAVINGNGDRCLPRDFRGGLWNQSSCNDRQSPNKEESSKHKRYISPARNKNCNISDKGARRKQLIGSNNNNNNNHNNYSSNNSNTFAKPVVSYEHDFLDGQLPSEKLKKQIDNFPTLVSMEYAESPTPQQVR